MTLSIRPYTKIMILNVIDFTFVICSVLILFLQIYYDYRITLDLFRNVRLMYDNCKYIYAFPNYAFSNYNYPNRILQIDPCPSVIGTDVPTRCYNNSGNVQILVVHWHETGIISAQNVPVRYYNGSVSRHSNILVVKTGRECPSGTTVLRH